MSKRKSRRRAFLVVVIGVVLLLVGTELGLRWFDPVRYQMPPDPLTEEQWSELIYRRSEVPGLTYELAPNRDTHVHGAPAVINSYGMRDEEPRTGDDAPDVRIAAIGDSFTYGFGVRAEQSYPEVLEAMLNRAGTGTFEVLNFGVGGYSTLDEALVLEHKVLAWDPDLVVLGYYFNDPEIDPVQPVTRYFVEPSWYHHFNLGRLFAQKERRRRVVKYGGGDYFRYLHNPDRRKWQSVVDGFASIHRLAAERDIPVLMLVFPLSNGKDWSEYPHRDLHEQVVAAGEAAGFSVIDLLDVYSQGPSLDVMMSPRDNHPNPRGHRLAAEAVHAWMVENTPELVTPGAAAESD